MDRSLPLAALALLLACQPSPKTQQATAVKTQADYPAPPTVAKKTVTFTNHGTPRVDDYYWLREKQNPAVLAYLNAENAYCDTVMQHTQALQDTLYKEMRGRIKEADQTVPTRDNGYYYQSRTKEGDQYRTYVRRKGSLQAPEELLVDENKMAEGHDYFDLASYEISPDNRLMAYAYNTDGSSVKFTLHIKDLVTGKDLPDVIENVFYGWCWANDNQTLFYTTVDAALRPHQVHRHRLGTDPKTDQLVYEEKDELFRTGIQRSKTGDWLVISSGSSTTSDARLCPASQPNGTFTVFQPRQKDTEYEVIAHKSRFFVLVKDKQSPNKKLMEAPLTGYADRAAWKEVVAHDPKVKIEDVDEFATFLGITARTNGLLEMRIRTLADGATESINFPEPTYAVYPGSTPDYDATTLRYVYTSLNRPTTTYDYDVTTGKSTQLKVQEVVGGFNPAEYEVKRVFAKTSDGTAVPISLVHKKGLALDGTNPALLYSYGSYGISTDATFSTNRISLLNRGFVFALAHIRGGSDLGEQWYEDGKLMNKKNTFTDFIACAEYLVSEKYTSPAKLAIEGGSAGGLLMGAVTNLRPDLFRVVLAEVPFVDVINTMLDTSLPLTVQEYEEWGNPNEKAAYDYMLSYSPYDNVTKKAYPNILATTGLNDSQVSYFEPAKWVAKLRTLKTDNNVLLLKTNMGAGHGGASGRFDYLKEVAFRYAFVLDRLGVAK